MSVKTRSKLYVQKSAGGMFSVLDPSICPANVYWVDSTNADATDDIDHWGHNPDTPLATLDYALGQVDDLDTIYLMPGHNEGMGDDQWALADDGVQIIGLGRGGDRARLDFDHANASFDVTGDDCLIKNIAFLPSAPGVLIGIDLNTGATGNVIEDCELMSGEDGAGADEFVKGIVLTSGNHYTKIKRTIILAHDTAGSATHGIHVAAASNYVELDNVVISGPYATAGFLETAASLEIMIQNCVMDVTGTNISLHANTTVAVRRNNVLGGVNEDILGIAVVRAAGNIAQNPAALNLFTITGRVMVTAIIGEVTTIIQAGANASNLSYNPTAGETQALCATLDIDADAQGTLLGVLGDPSLAMVRMGCVMTNPVILEAGVIQQDCAAASTGQIQWTLYYKIVEPGSTVVAA